MVEHGRSLVLDGVSHRFGGSLAVDAINLDVKAGELIALLGPSGCGKTTLLRIIAGFLRQTDGRVIIGDEVVDDRPPNARKIGIVFQSYALFPHMSIADNVAYGLVAQGIPKAARADEVRRLLSLVQLEAMAGRLPRALSGGQQQRVALARALAIKPSILLLDEPFAALDKNLRLDMQIEIKRLQRFAGVTTVLVTHDQEEALSMADRVAVLSRGKLEQFSAPTTIYDCPQSYFVNTFVGAANVMNGTVIASDATGAKVRLDAGADIIARSPPSPMADGTHVLVCLRPEHLRIVEDGSGFPALVEMALPLGATVVHEVRGLDGKSIKISEPRLAGEGPRPAGTQIRVAPAADGLASIYIAS